MQEQSSSNSSGLSAGQIEIYTQDTPALPAGDYTLRVDQSVSHDNDPQGSYTANLAFTVTGPQLSLNADQVVEVFPPARSPGAWQESLPYITLSSPSLPWESEIPVPGTSDPVQQAPWLALVVLTDEELGTSAQPVTTGKLSDLVTPSSTSILAPTFSPVPSTQAQEAQVQMLDIPSAAFTANMPSAGDMQLLAHVRKTSDDETYSIVMANRLPQQSKNNYAFLISLEGLEDYLPGGSGTISDDKTAVRVAVLHSWQLGPVTEDGDFCSDFLALSENGNTAMLKLESSIAGQTGTILEQGFVPLTWHMRSGEEMTAWYRGPFVPVATKEDLITPPEASGILPAVLHSDQLLRYDQSTGMFDVSYAAAFEVGRLLALSTPSYLTQIAGWRAGAVSQALKDAGNTYSEARANLASGGNSAAETTSTPPPVSIQNWLARQAQLTGLPPTYLLPNADLLPAECLRFFLVDQNWIYYFLMGALSVGILEDSALAHHQGSAHTAVTQAMTQANNGEGWVEPISGYVMRSQLVTDFPKMTMEALAADGKPLVRLQQQTLSGSLAFALFYGVPQSVSFTQPEQHMQFGVYPSDNGFIIPARYVSGSNIGSEIPGSDGAKDSPVQVALRTGSTGVLDVTTTAQQLASVISVNDSYLQGISSLNAGEFAVQVIKPAGQFTFSWSPTSTNSNSGEVA